MAHFVNTGFAELPPEKQSLDNFLSKDWYSSDVFNDHVSKVGKLEVEIYEVGVDGMGTWQTYSVDTYADFLEIFKVPGLIVRVKNVRGLNGVWWDTDVHGITLDRLTSILHNYFPCLTKIIPSPVSTDKLTDYEKRFLFWRSVAVLFFGLGSPWHFDTVAHLSDRAWIELCDAVGLILQGGKYFAVINRMNDNDIKQFLNFGYDQSKRDDATARNDYYGKCFRNGVA